jgi:hypothetical protein
MVAVAHPHIEAVGQPWKESAGTVHMDGSRPVLPGSASLKHASERMSHELESIAYSEDRDAEIEYPGVDPGVVIIEN